MHLYLLRHAKSSWDNPNLGDFDRPLNKRGQKSAPLMGSVLKERKIKPDKILCSPSVRTKETLELVLGTSKLKSPVEFVDGIYDASVGDLRSILRKQETDDQSILMIGHNPGMEGLLDNLTGIWERFPTACLAHIILDLEEWGDLKPGCGKLNWILRPKELVS